MTEPGHGPGHSGLSRSQCYRHEDRRRQDQSVLRHQDMAAAVFQTVKADHNHTSAALYVPPSSPSMSPSPPWKLTASTSPHKVDKVPSPTSDNEVICLGVGDKKPKRRRSSFLSTSELSPTSKSAAAVSGAPRLTERQQLALLLQMTAEKRDERDHVGYESSRSSGSRSSGRTSRRTATGRNERGELPLHRAARRGDVKQTKRLLKDGADVNCRDYAGWTPLHEASNHGHLSVARELLRAGADSNAQGLDNNSPLHDAAVNGHVELVQLLLHHGANPLAKNSDGESPLDVASAAEVTRLLRSEIIASSSSDDDYDVRSPTSPESDVDDMAMTSPADTEPADITTAQTQLNDDKHDDDVFTLTPPPEVHHVDVQLTTVDESDHKLAPRSPSFADESLASSAAQLPLPARSGRASPVPPVRRKFIVSRQMVRSSSSSARLTLKFQHIKRHTVTTAPQLNNGRWRFSPDSDVITDRCDDIFSRVEEPRDSVPRDTVDQQESDDVPAQLSCQTSTTEDVTSVSDAVESEPRRLFEDISDAEDEPVRQVTPPREADDSQDVSPVSLFQSPVGSTPTFDMVQSWPCTVPDDCSSSLPAAADAAAAVTCQFFPAVNAAAVGPPDPELPFCADLTSSPPPPLEDMMAARVMQPRVMTPLTIDTDFETTRCQEVKDAGDAAQSDAEVMDTAQQRADDVTDTSQLTSYAASEIDRSPQMMSAVTEQPPPTTSVSFDETASAACVSPSPPKIPRLRIVMGAGDSSQMTASPGSNASSLPYVVRVDDVLGDVTEQSVLVTSPRRDVIDDVTESSSSLAESVSRHQRKVKHNATVKERECDEVSVGTETEANDDSRLTANDETQTTSTERRVTRSAVRQLQNKSKQKAELSASTAHDSTQSQSNGGGEVNVDSGSTTRAADATDDESSSSRRQKHCKQRVDVASSTSSLSLSTSIPRSPRKPTNPYSLYSMLRKKVAEQQARMLERRCDVRLPARYRDYLIVKRSYRLHGPESVVSALQVKPPRGLTGKMRELFCEQEQQRQELLLEHCKERVRLIVQAEQESLRVHERMSRVGSVLNACSLLDGVTTTRLLPDSDRLQRTCDSSRNCDQMMRDIEDKFIRLREDLLVRHHHEADILCATQRLQWDWGSRRCNDQHTWTAPVHNEYVPPVDVNDRLDLFLI